MPAPYRHFHAAIVDVDDAVDPDFVRTVAAALQKQVNEHFAPIWNVGATVTAGVEPDHHPLTIEVQKKTEQRFGFHLKRGELGERDRPYASVSLDALKDEKQWPRVASHELLEMLADPWGNGTIPGPDPKGHGRTVEYLVEVGDPCNLDWYELEGFPGIPVSDFVLPHYYSASQPGPYSHTGSIKAPFEVRKGGYLTFRYPGHRTTWFWKHYPLDAEGPKIEQVPKPLLLHSFREQIDALASEELMLHPAVDDRET
jgi:hypothetical protein